MQRTPRAAVVMIGVAIRTVDRLLPGVALLRLAVCSCGILVGWHCEWEKFAVQSYKELIPWKWYQETTATTSAASMLLSLCTPPGVVVVRGDVYSLWSGIGRVRAIGQRDESLGVVRTHPFFLVRESGIPTC